MEKRRKRYRIRPNSPADYFVNVILPILGFAALFIATGLMNSWELGLL